MESYPGRTNYTAYIEKKAKEIATLNDIIELKESERKQWADLCIKKQSIIESGWPDGWVELKDGNPLPDYDEYVLWIFEDGNMLVQCLDKDGNQWLHGGSCDGFDFPPATHWRPLPLMPNSEQNAQASVATDDDSSTKAG